MKKQEELAALCQQCGCTMLVQEPLRYHTTFRIGGACSAYIKINSIAALQQVLQFCKENQLRYTVLGKGSNVLVPDTGYDGIVIKMGVDFSAITQIDDRTFCCQAGTMLSRAALFALDASLTGMECLYGIPGTIGGALFMNAGAYGRDMSDVVKEATYLDENGTLQTIAAADMQLSYRHSFFMAKHNPIVSVTVQLQPGKYGAIKTEMETLMNRRRAKQPLELPSAGSTFKRPVGSYASMLIDQCGLKGASVGDAQVSFKHAGFVVNTGKATCQDVLELCAYVQETVQEKTGYHLELEPIILR